MLAVADRFLQFRFGGKARDLHKITPTDIVRFMQQLVSRGKPFRDKTPPTHLRNFFRFLFKSGKTNVNLTPSVPRVAQKYAPRLPRHLTSEQVETLIAAVRTNTAMGRRNYARHGGSRAGSKTHGRGALARPFMVAARLLPRALPLGKIGRTPAAA